MEAPLERVPVIALLLGGAAGLLLSGHDLGIGATVLALAAIVRLWPRAESRWARGWLGAAALLSLTATLRDADWLVAGSLATALGLMAVAVVDARSWRELADVTPRWLGGAAYVIFALPELAMRRLQGAQHPAIGPVTRGVAAAVPVATLFALLFASADRAFGHLFAELASGLVSTDLAVSNLATRIGIGLGVMVVMTTLLRLRAATAEHEELRVADPRYVEWTILLGAVVAVFAVFLAIQLRATIGGDEYVRSTTGVTYAEYARSGFAQLILVAILTLGLLARFGIRGTTRATVPRALAGALCLLALAVVASAWWRLSLYEEAFGATRLRFLTHMALLWFGGVFVLILATGATQRASLMPRLAVSLTAVLAVGAAAINPEGRIAAENIARSPDGARLDVQYLGTLSADADGALAALPATRAACLAQREGSDGSLVAWNWSRHQSDERGTRSGDAKQPRCR